MTLKLTVKDEGRKVIVSKDGRVWKRLSLTELTELLDQKQAKDKE